MFRLTATSSWPVRLAPCFSFFFLPEALPSLSNLLRTAFHALPRLACPAGRFAPRPPPLPASAPSSSLALAARSRSFLGVDAPDSDWAVRLWEPNALAKPGEGNGNALPRREGCGGPVCPAGPSASNWSRSSSAQSTPSSPTLTLWRLLGRAGVVVPLAGGDKSPVGAVLFFLPFCSGRRHHCLRPHPQTWTGSRSVRESSSGGARSPPLRCLQPFS